MRKVLENQYKLGQIDIANVEIDIQSRDEIPKALLGLQHIYSQNSLFQKVASILEGLTPEEVSPEKGREGMSYWQILVLGVLRLICNWDYDKLRDIANNHSTIRLMLGLSPDFDAKKCFGLQTLIDNISLFTPDTLSKINQLVVQEGHKQFGDPNEGIDARCDSFVVETNVHYPTDINLLFDSMRKVITLISRACFTRGYSDWRQSTYNIRNVKKLFTKVRKMKHSNSKNPQKQLERESLINEAYEAYLDLSEKFLQKTEQTINKLGTSDPFTKSILDDVERFKAHGYRQISQIRRRIFEGEKIPHNEKVFSVFEEHTEWICKGKAGVPQELGVRVSIVEDTFGFILHHRVMQNETDDKVAVAIIQDTQSLHPDLRSCSFDKGYYSPANCEALEKCLDFVVLPKKGKLSAQGRQTEHSCEFRSRRRQHSAVESAINALENHGLDRCPDKGISGFERYVALAVLARNFEKLGAKIQARQQASERRSKKYNSTLKSNCVIAS